MRELFEFKKIKFKKVALIIPNMNHRAPKYNKTRNVRIHSKARTIRSIRVNRKWEW